MVFSHIFMTSLVIFFLNFVTSQDNDTNLSEPEIARRNVFYYACCLNEARKNMTGIYVEEPKLLEFYCSYSKRIREYEDFSARHGADATLPPKGPEDFVRYRSPLAYVYACESNKKNATECCIKRNVAPNCLRDCDGTSKVSASDCMPKDKVSIIKCFQEVAYADCEVPAHPTGPSETSPNETSPNETSHNGTLPNETSHNETSPNETSHNETLPNETSHNETASTEANSAMSHQIAHILNVFGVIFFALYL